MKTINLPPFDLLIEQDEDGHYIASHHFITVCGDGPTEDAAIADFISSWLEYQRMTNGTEKHEKTIEIPPVTLILKFNNELHLQLKNKNSQVLTYDASVENKKVQDALNDLLVSELLMRQKVAAQVNKTNATKEI